MEQILIHTTDSELIAELRRKIDAGEGNNARIAYALQQRLSAYRLSNMLVLAWREVADLNEQIRDMAPCTAQNRGV